MFMCDSTHDLRPELLVASDPHTAERVSLTGMLTLSTGPKNPTDLRTLPLSGSRPRLTPSRMSVRLTDSGPREVAGRSAGDPEEPMPTLRSVRPVAQRKLDLNGNFVIGKRG